MLDLDLRTELRDGARRFQLQVTLRSEARVIGFYGPSGAGKTLSLQAIAGLLPLQQGHVRLAGQTLFDAKARVDVPVPARRIGYLFQHYALFPHLSVRANVGFGLTRWWQRRLAPADAERVDALLQRFGLAELADSRPDRLSGGQRQRVALARALACQPRLLLLDEPFAALNPQLRRGLREELAATLRDAGLPAVLVTHDVDDLLALADEAWLFDDGLVTKRVDLRGAPAAERREALLGGS